MMRQTFLPLAAAVFAATAFVPVTASAQAFDDQAKARQEMEAGNLIPVRDIERRIVPRYERQGYEYLNFEYDARAAAYRLKFIRQGRVMFVDVDARSGRVIGVRR